MKANDIIARDGKLELQPGDRIALDGEVSRVPAPPHPSMAGGLSLPYKPTPHASCTFNAWSECVLRLAQYPNVGANRVYPALGLVGEIGECSELVKKMIRDDGGKLSPERAAKMTRELGDVAWYVAACLAELGAVPSLAGLVGFEAVADFSASDPESASVDPVACVLSMAVGAGVVADLLLDARERPESGKNETRNALYRIMRRIDRMARWSGSSLEGVLAENVVKLYKRSEAGTLGGSGSDR